MAASPLEMRKCSPRHALSVDVEDENNVTVFHQCGRIVPPTQRVVRNTEILLDLVLEYHSQATWFVLGEVAEAYPGLIRRLADAGQEIAVHGFHHAFVSSLSNQEFRASIRRAKDCIEQASGKAALGHRAPAFSITPQTPWAFEVLAELGFRYDSSVFPVRTRRYGDSAASLRASPIQPRHGELTEVPLSAVKFGPWRLPCCGGGYLRHFPLAYTLWSLRRIEREQRPAVVYVHPYEADLSLDRDYLSRQLGEKKLAEIRWNIYAQCRNRGHTISKLRYLLSTRHFAGIARVFGLECPKPYPCS
ncbi:MAG: polysaccharide deacetylase family protein [Armatimonadota bacterium]